ncbi:hypothetical protein HDV02_002657 [Globomyces sp. JEL0801]|nr:hypothetical protein HDV02_002657 [Globomyces sp. JEL0801]
MSVQKFIKNPTITHQLTSQAHNLYVRRLYKRSLRLAMDWYWRREEYREKAILIRREFERNKSLSNVKLVERTIGYTEYMLGMN